MFLCIWTKALRLLTHHSVASCLAVSFGVELLHFLRHAGLSGASCVLSEKDSFKKIRRDGYRCRIMIEGRAAASESTRSHTDAPLPLVLRWLRTIGFIEGISTLMLFGIAMPLKYAADRPMAVTVVGSVHGGLFIVYLATIFWVMVVYRWPLFRGVALLVASILPLGPFVMDRRIACWYASDAGSVGNKGRKEA